MAGQLVHRAEQAIFPTTVPQLTFQPLPAAVEEPRGGQHFVSEAALLGCPGRGVPSNGIGCASPFLRSFEECPREPASLAH